MKKVGNGEMWIFTAVNRYAASIVEEEEMEAYFFKVKGEDTCMSFLLETVKASRLQEAFHRGCIKDNEQKRHGQWLSLLFTFLFYPDGGYLSSADTIYINN